MKKLLIALSIVSAAGSALAYRAIEAGPCDKEGAEVNHLRCEHGVWLGPQARLDALQIETKEVDRLQEAKVFAATLARVVLRLDKNTAEVFIYRQTGEDYSCDIALSDRKGTARAHDKDPARACYLAVDGLKKSMQGSK